MLTVEVPRTEWVQALNEFASVHQGWLVSVEVLSPDIGAQPAIDNLALAGVWVDRDTSIIITAARSTGEHVTHVVPDVSRVYIERTEEGADAALGVQSDGDTTTILKFRTVALPETVDGVAQPMRHNRTSR